MPGRIVLPQPGDQGIAGQKLVTDKAGQISGNGVLLVWPYAGSAPPTGGGTAAFPMQLDCCTAAVFLSTPGEMAAF